MVFQDKTDYPTNKKKAKNNLNHSSKKRGGGVQGVMIIITGLMGFISLPLHTPKNICSDQVTGHWICETIGV